jgi:hypothetical protein
MNVGEEEFVRFLVGNPKGKKALGRHTSSKDGIRWYEPE